MAGTHPTAITPGCSRHAYGGDAVASACHTHNANHAGHRCKPRSVKEQARPGPRHRDMAPACMEVRSRIAGAAAAAARPSPSELRDSSCCSAFPPRCCSGSSTSHGCCKPSVNSNRRSHGTTVTTLEKAPAQVSAGAALATLVSPEVSSGPQSKEWIQGGSQKSLQARSTSIPQNGRTGSLGTGSSLPPASACRRDGPQEFSLQWTVHAAVAVGTSGE